MSRIHENISLYFTNYTKSVKLTDTENFHRWGTIITCNFFKLLPTFNFVGKIHVVNTFHFVSPWRCSIFISLMNYYHYYFLQNESDARASCHSQLGCLQKDGTCRWTGRQIWERGKKKIFSIFSHGIWSCMIRLSFLRSAIAPALLQRS